MSLEHVLIFANSYHKNSLSKEQLEAIVLELQKKVKVLQQRHRRHLDKLLGLETTVSQLRQTNLVNEERLQLLERVRNHFLGWSTEMLGLGTAPSVENARGLVLRFTPLAKYKNLEPLYR